MINTTCDFLKIVMFNTFFTSNWNWSGLESWWVSATTNIGRSWKWWVSETEWKLKHVNVIDLTINWNLTNENWGAVAALEREQLRDLVNPNLGFNQKGIRIWLEVIDWSSKDCWSSCPNSVEMQPCLTKRLVRGSVCTWEIKIETWVCPQ